METVEIVKEFLKGKGYKDILDELPREKKDWSSGSVLVYQSKDINKTSLKVSVIEEKGISLLEVEYGEVDLDGILEQAEELRVQLENEDFEEYEDNLEDL